MAFLKMAYTGFQRFRKRRKNLTIVLIVCVSLVFFFVSLFSTENRNLHNFWVNSFIGGDIIISRDYKNFDFNNPTPPEFYFRMNQFLQGNRYIEQNVAPHLRVGALLESKKSTNSIPCLIIGANIQKEQKINKGLSVLDGRFPKPGKNEIILSEYVAANLNVKVGDQVIIYAITKEGYINFDLFTLVGYLSLSLAEQSNNQLKAYISIDKLREFTLTSPDTVSELLYKRDNTFFSWNLKGPYRIINGLRSFSTVRSIYLGFMFIEIVIFILLFSICINSIYQNIILSNIEREKEIGVYLTCGATPTWIRKLMILELIIYVGFCTLIGCIISFLIITGINALGIYSIDVPTELLMSCPHFIMRTDLPIFIETLVIFIFLVSVSSIKPIWKSTQIYRVVNLFN
jgi:ABC-type lipoprotein release transport system permease subunit